ncbi:hypothetical protein EDC04DRAFT_2691598 [Pisolithus marmoratus]|nr:hypothetical protein EDC04DRAFT_2691598 [Pisolithus marmoratus]
MPPRTLLSKIAAWLLPILKAMPSIGSAFLRILRFILSLSTASSPRKHGKSNIVRHMYASSMPYPLEQREMSEASPSRIHPPVTTDASGGMGLATQPEDSITRNLPFHHSQHPVEVQPVGDRPRNMSRRLLVPASPEQVMQHRFLKRLPVDDTREPEEILKQGDMNYDAPSLPIGWMKYTQPEGAPYYLHAEKRIITDVTDPQKLATVVDTSNSLLDRARQLGLPSHLNVELVISDVFGREKRKDLGYYFIDLRQRLLFWVHDYDLSTIFSNVKGVTVREHMKQAVVTQYWVHHELYPNRRELKANDYEELRNTLTYAIADAATSGTPLAPFDLDSMARMLDLVDKLEGSIGKENPYAVWVIARFARAFSHSKFINFGGQPCARLNADQSIYASHHHLSRSGSSLLIRIFDLLLFQSASVHLEELRQMWVDQIVHYPRWQKYIAKLTSEWARFTIFSTVLLTADVSLLAVPALGGGGGGGPGGGTLTNSTGSSGSGPSPPVASQMTAAVTSIYLSIFFSVASILTSIQLTDRVGGKEYSTATTTSRLLLHADKSLFGTDGLAIMYSLPYAFLVWGIFLFVLGMSLVVFSSTSQVMPASLAPFFFLLFTFSISPSISGHGTYEALGRSWRNLLKCGRVCTTVKETERDVV